MGSLKCDCWGFVGWLGIKDASDQIVASETAVVAAIGAAIAPPATAVAVQQYNGGASDNDNVRSAGVSWFATVVGKAGDGQENDNLSSRITKSCWLNILGIIEQILFLLFSGLNKRTTTDGLKEAFSKFGEVLNAKVVTDCASGYSKGFGFVRYATLEEAAAGIRAWMARFWMVGLSLQSMQDQDHYLVLHHLGTMDLHMVVNESFFRGRS
ncbi:hypothetical protein F0562_010191 [Nyssa sinensis]|uniref:RRM domain-containing protein n=1 Tax=Nyssa sinensis TaxID=561372 RepID=A0A5J5A1B8_9ASTE|nr:hypothetical protein F0562_010191 [Nyssa sinensis]